VLFLHPRAKPKAAARIPGATGGRVAGPTHRGAAGCLSGLAAHLQIEEGTLFRRNKSETDTTSSADETTTVKPGAKGRPTPTRREAEAAAKARAKAPRTRKELAARQRQQRAASSEQMRAALRGKGDERYLPARDRGPMKRFVRDFVDARFSLVELLIPLMIVTLILGYSGNARLAAIGNAILLGTLVMVTFDMLLMRGRLRKQLARRFPGESTKGTTYYAVVRALQMRFMRMPKAQVKIGQSLPETYR
jgi:hypothetical protein